jgi:hypothetical protein
MAKKNVRIAGVAMIAILLLSPDHRASQQLISPPQQTRR